MIILSVTQIGLTITLVYQKNYKYISQACFLERDASASGHLL